MRRLLAVMVALAAAPAAAQDFDAAVRDLFGDDPARYRTVIEAFQQAVRDGDAAAAADLVRYPIEVEVDGRARIVHDAADFSKHFGEIVTPAIAAAVQDEPLARMLVNWQGVMLGQGEVWVAGTCADAACTAPLVQVVAIQPVPEAAPAAVGAVKAYRDWRVGCDNRLGCSAIGLPEDPAAGAGYVALRLAAGAAAEPSLAFVLVATQAAGARMTVAIEGRDPVPPFELDAVADGAWVRAEVPAAQRAGVIRALRDGDRVALSLGESAPVTLSLRGATAALLRIDDIQWRIGTVTALARPGDGPAASVAVPPERQAEPALPVAEADPPDPLPAGIDAAGDASCEAVGPLAFGLGGGWRLIGRCELAAAYNQSFRFWLDGPDGAAPAAFPVPGRTAGAVLINPSPAADGRGVEAVDLGRGVGDCGEASRWAWTGSEFVLVRLAALDDCAGVAPDDWPVLWRGD